MAPSTCGTFLRAFTFGHVRQLDAWSGSSRSVTRRGPPGRGPAPRRDRRHRLDDLRDVNGYQKQAATFGYTKRARLPPAAGHPGGERRGPPRAVPQGVGEHRAGRRAVRPRGHRPGPPGRRQQVRAADPGRRRVLVLQARGQEPAVTTTLRLLDHRAAGAQAVRSRDRRHRRRRLAAQIDYTDRRRHAGRRSQPTATTTVSWCAAPASSAPQPETVRQLAPPRVHHRWDRQRGRTRRHPPRSRRRTNFAIRDLKERRRAHPLPLGALPRQRRLGRARHPSPTT